MIIFLIKFQTTFAQFEIKMNVTPMLRKSFEPNFEYYFTKRFSAEIMPMIGFINPIKTAKVDYWYQPRYGFGAGVRYYWGEKQNNFKFYNGIITKHNTQTFGTKNQTITRTEHLTGLNTGIKIKLKRHWFIDLSIAYIPSAEKKYKEEKSNTYIEYVAPITWGGGGDWNFNIPSFNLPNFNNKALMGSILLSYRF